MAKNIPNDPLLSSRKGVLGGNRWSRVRYYTLELLFFSYIIFWIWAWYGIVGAERWPLLGRIMIGILLFFARPTGIPFIPYEKAMKRMGRSNTEMGLHGEGSQEELSEGDTN